MESAISILVADDERASRDLLRKALSRSDRRISVARDGSGAVELLDREAFDVPTDNYMSFLILVTRDL